VQVKRVPCSQKHGTDALKQSTMSSGVGGSKWVKTWKILHITAVRKSTDLMKMLKIAASCYLQTVTVDQAYCIEILTSLHEILR
jgi:hypothetical protein